MTDPAALAERIRGGDTAAENEFAQMFHVDVLRLIRGRTGDAETSRELANDVLIAVICALRDGRLHDLQKLRAFVHGTARNVANNYIRMRATRPREEELTPDAAAPPTPDRLETRERLMYMYRGMARLALRDREILMRTMDGHEPRQIARDLGLSSQVVRARKSRALQRLIAFAKRPRDA